MRPIILGKLQPLCYPGAGLVLGGGPGALEAHVAVIISLVCPRYFFAYIPSYGIHATGTRWDLLASHSQR